MELTDTDHVSRLRWEAPQNDRPKLAELLGSLEENFMIQHARLDAYLIGRPESGPVTDRPLVVLSPRHIPEEGIVHAAGLRQEAPDHDARITYASQSRYELQTTKAAFVILNDVTYPESDYYPI